MNIPEQCCNLILQLTYFVIVDSGTSNIYNNILFQKIWYIVYRKSRNIRWEFNLANFPNVRKRQISTQYLLISQKKF